MLKLNEAEIEQANPAYFCENAVTDVDKQIADHAAEHAAKEMYQFVKDWGRVYYAGQFNAPDALADWLHSQGVEV